eukprot:gene208-10_t
MNKAIRFREEMEKKEGVVVQSGGGHGAAKQSGVKGVSYKKERPRPKGKGIIRASWLAEFQVGDPKKFKTDPRNNYKLTATFNITDAKPCDVQLAGAIAQRRAWEMERVVYVGGAGASESSTGGADGERAPKKAIADASGASRKKAPLAKRAKSKSKDVKEAPAAGPLRGSAKAKNAQNSASVQAPKKDFEKKHRAGATSAPNKKNEGATGKGLAKGPRVAQDIAVKRGEKKTTSERRTTKRVPSKDGS